MEVIQVARKGRHMIILNREIQPHVYEKERDIVQGSVQSQVEVLPHGERSLVLLIVAGRLHSISLLSRSSVLPCVVTADSHSRALLNLISEAPTAEEFTSRSGNAQDSSWIPVLYVTHSSGNKSAASVSNSRALPHFIDTGSKCMTSTRSVRSPSVAEAVRSVGKEVNSAHFMNVSNPSVCKKEAECKIGFSPESSGNSETVVEHSSVYDMFKCDTCGREFVSRRYLQRHVVCHSQERPFACSVCERRFKRNGDVAAHMKNRHRNERDHMCDVCNFGSNNKSAVERHRRRHFNQFSLQCDVCGWGCYSIVQLKEHQNLHTGATPFECDACSKCFSTKGRLKYHKETKHPDPTRKSKRPQCDLCGKTFSFQQSLVLHLKSHMGENTYLCDICGKVVTSRESFQVHRRIHTGEKPNVCNKCGKAFSSTAGLRLHKRTHTGERPFTCDECGKSFTQCSTLTVHKRYHSGHRPHQCEICSKVFVTKTRLNHHRKTHGD